MKNELEQLRKEFNERIDALVKKETTVETGKWYKTEEGAIVFVEDYGKNKKIGYGFTGLKGQIISFVEDWHNYNYEFTPATDKEVEEALIKEAIKRGFKEWVRIKNVNGIVGTIGKEFSVNETYFRNGTLNFHGAWIFQGGKWAEIIKDEHIKIGGYEVVFYGEKSKGDMLYTKIDGNDFLKTFWEAAKLISEHSKAKIMVGCSKQFDVSLKTINEILDKLK